MKTISCIVCCCWCLIFSGFAQQMNVATYNIRMDTPADSGNRWNDRYTHLAQLVQFHKFDLFGTQEGFKHQLDDLKSSLPGFSYIGVGREDGKEKGEYAAIFFDSTKFEVIDQGTFWLSENTQTPNIGWDAVLPRICTWGLFQDQRSGFRFFLFNTHFDHVGTEARQESARLIVQQAKERGSDTPLIITGDFNVDQNSDSYRVLQTGGVVQDAYELSPLKYAPNGTFNGFDITQMNESRIDHIFLSPPFEVLRYGILTDSYLGKLPSDHFPVMAEIRY